MMTTIGLANIHHLVYRYNIKGIGKKALFFFSLVVRTLRTSQVAQREKNLPANIGDTVSIPGSGSSPGERNANQLQYFCLENSWPKKKKGKKRLFFFLVVRILRI